MKLFYTYQISFGNYKMEPLCGKLLNIKQRYYSLVVSVANRAERDFCVSKNENYFVAYNGVHFCVNKNYPTH